MSQSQQPFVRSFIAVDFRGIRESSKERTSLGVAGTAGVDPLRRAATFGALYDAAYLLGVALNDGSPVRFASAAATRAAVSPSGILGI